MNVLRQRPDFVIRRQDSGELRCGNDSAITVCERRSQPIVDIDDLLHKAICKNRGTHVLRLHTIRDAAIRSTRTF